MDYGRQVFVNCPFDADYQSTFDAIVFSVFRCGYLPRCAKEVQDSSETRIEKIVRLIRDCRLAVHDISRTELNPEGLPRFNMPFELGLFLGAKRFGNPQQRQKQCLILDVEPYRYQRFMSDIAGQDVVAHEADSRKVVTHVIDWLANFRSGLPSGTIIWSQYQEFQLQLPEICQKSRWLPQELTYKDYASAVEYWLQARPKIVQDPRLLS